MKDIEGYEHYQITEDGRVWSKERRTPHWQGGHRRIQGRWVASYISKNGYVRYNLYKDGKPKHFSAHRLVASAYISNLDTLPQVNHKDGNKLNNHHSNLEWCTSSYNNLHKTRVRKQGIRENHPIAVLTETQVSEIRRRYKLGGITQEILGLEYGVWDTTISAIITNKTWNDNLPKELDPTKLFSADRSDSQTN